MEEEVLTYFNIQIQLWKKKWSYHTLRYNLSKEIMKDIKTAEHKPFSMGCHSVKHLYDATSCQVQQFHVRMEKLAFYTYSATQINKNPRRSAATYHGSRDDVKGISQCLTHYFIIKVL
jgi:hypothetical protein